ncbi:MAG TPA: hypothetical protein VFB17_08030 [Gaiellaceae bacterium]|nr:hypothetical protein [Gaiellaceae bacterium]
MSFAFPHPDHMPCPDCGASVAVDEPAHVCDEERRLDYRVAPEIARFDDELGRWLDTPAGRFARWLAERDRER